MYFRSAPVSSVLFAPASVSVSSPSAAASEFSVTPQIRLLCAVFLMVIVHYEVDPLSLPDPGFLSSQQNHACCQHSRPLRPQTAPTSFPSSASHLLRLTHIPPAIGIFPCPAWQVTIKNPFLVGCADGIFTFKPVLYYGQRNKCADLLSSYHCSSFSPHALPVASVPGTGRNTSSSYHYRSSGSYPPCVRNSARYLHTP